jgi:hypothetical protein
MIQEPAARLIKASLGRQYTFAHGNGPTATTAANSCHRQHTAITNHRCTLRKAPCCTHQEAADRRVSQKHNRVRAHTG